MSLAANVVVLVPGEYQISIATYLRGYGVYPHIKFERDSLNTFRLRACGRTDRQTHSHNTIVSQPLRGSTNELAIPLATYTNHMSTV